MPQTLALTLCAPSHKSITKTQQAQHTHSHSHRPTTPNTFETQWKEQKKLLNFSRAFNWIVHGVAECAFYYTSGNKVICHLTSKAKRPCIKLTFEFGRTGLRLIFRERAGNDSVGNGMTGHCERRDGSFIPWHLRSQLETRRQLKKIIKVRSDLAKVVKFRDEEQFWDSPLDLCV